MYVLAWLSLVALQALPSLKFHQKMVELFGHLRPDE